MDVNKFSGNYLNAFLNDAFFEENKESRLLEKKITVGENEAVYIYSLKERKLLFLKGFDKMIGFKKTEISIPLLQTIWKPATRSFFNEFHDRVLLYLYNNNENIKNISFNSIVELSNSKTPVKHTVKVFETDENGNLVSVIVRLCQNENLKLSDIIQYSITGEIDEKAFKDIKYNLTYKKCISKREIEIIESFQDKKKSNTIISKVLLNPAEFIVVLENLITRFGLETREELIKFAKDNYLIPCQL